VEENCAHWKKSSRKRVALDPSKKGGGILDTEKGAKIQGQDR